MDIKELEDSIIYYSTKYYNGEPELTDAQFDSLVDKLRELNPNSTVLKTGWGFEVFGDKVKHLYSHIGSLDKTKTYEDIPNRFKNKTVYISPKLDGLSAVAYYRNGLLKKGITRGNGVYGKDITDKLLCILGDSISDKKFTGAVRGELIISNKNWNLLQQKYTGLISARNFAAGIINRNELDEDLQYIDLVTYKITGQENTPLFTKRDEVLQWLSLNFKYCVPQYYYPVLNEQSWNMYHEDTFKTFKKLGYDLDGLVLTNSDVLYNSQTMGYVYDEVAFKFNAETTSTYIEKLDWELSRTQRLVPIAVVNPVELSGAVISRATCNNAKMVKELGLGTGAEINIQRANEVIPYIVDVIQPSTEPLPTNCPKCNSLLVWDGVDLKCNNPNCLNIQESNLQQWCECVGETDGLQWTLMKQYLDKYNITSIQSLYEKQSSVLTDLNSRKLSITELKIKEFFEKLYINPVLCKKALIGLNIPRLGEKTAEILSKEECTVMQFFWYCMNSVYNYYKSNECPTQRLIELVKEATTQSLLDNTKKFTNLKYLINLDDNTSRLVFSKNVDVTNIKYIAVTGSLQSMKRKDFEKYIQQYGYNLTTNLKKCEYLVNNDITSTSTKNKQAKEYNIPIITEQDFLNLLNK